MTDTDECSCQQCDCAAKLREARRQAYRDGYNDAHRSSELGHIIYGYPRTVRTAGYDPAATENRP